MATTTTRLRVTCCVCDVILVPGKTTDDGQVSSGICPPCNVAFYGDLGRQVNEAPFTGPVDNGARRRVIRDYVAGLRGDQTVTAWTREEDPVLWIRANTDHGIELVRAEVLARDGAGNWYVLTDQLERRSFGPDDVLTTSLEEAL